MELTPSDIRNRSFSKGLRGLNADEVHSFLDQVADKWGDLQEQVESLRDELDDVQQSLDAARAAKAQAEEQLEETADKQAHLDEREHEIEQKAARLRSVAQRLQSTLQEEQDVLASVASQEGTADEQPPPTDEISLDEPIEAEQNGQARSGTGGGTSQSAPSPTDASAEPDEKTSEEWVDSLFPNRLPSGENEAPGQPAADDRDDEEENLSASESQFEAIKEDVQGMNNEEAPDASSAASEEEDDDGAPPTDEMERIWDVFNDSP